MGVLFVSFWDLSQRDMYLRWSSAKRACARVILPVCNAEHRWTSSFDMVVICWKYAVVSGLMAEHGRNEKNSKIYNLYE
jgi:hypothetical protein